MIKFINPLTNEIRFVKLGLSWTLFFFYPIVLFVRKIYDLGIVVFAVSVYFGIESVFILSFNDGFDGASLSIAILTTLSLFIDCGIRAFFLLLGNKLTAKKYIDNGFRVVAENELQLQQIKIAWKLPDEAFINPDKQMENK